MPRIEDPDNLSQGTVTTVTVTSVTVADGTDNDAQFNAASGLPTITAGDYFEVRGAVDPTNNGLYTCTSSSGTALLGTKVAGSIGFTVAQASSDSVDFLSTNGASTEKSVYYDTYSKKVWLFKQGNMDDEGVTFQALYSFSKEEWKDDAFLIKFDFPFIAITPEQFEIQDGWSWYDDVVTPAGETGRRTREMLRTAGWEEFDPQNGSLTNKIYSGIISLGTFEATDGEGFAYFQQGSDNTDTTAPTNFVFEGPVNEGVLVYDYNFGNTSIFTNGTGTGNTYTTDIAITGNTLTRTEGSWIENGYNIGGAVTVITANTGANADADASYEITALSATVLEVTGNPGPWTSEAADSQFSSAADNRSTLNLFLRANTATLSKSFSSADLEGIGVTTLTSQAYRFPLTNSIDPKISVSDTDLNGASPYAQTFIRYFGSTPYDRQVDSATGGDERPFSIVIDAGTFSMIDLEFSDSNTATTAAGGIPASEFDGGTLYINQDNNKSLAGYTVTTASGGTIDISDTFPNTTDTGISGYLARAAFTPPTIEQIYNRVQYLLRQGTDINDNANTATADIVGKTADELLVFVGDAITASGNTTTAFPPPYNPVLGANSGVFIEGFDNNDINDVTVFDNDGQQRNFPFTASFNIDFNPNLEGDTDSKYWIFYDRTHRRTGSFQIESAAGRSANLTASAVGYLDGIQRNANSATSGTTQMNVNDYIRCSGFTNGENNGIWRITDATDLGVNDLSITVTKVDGDDPVNEGPTASVNVDEDPVDTPDAIIVDDASGTPLNGVATSDITGATFDFTGNGQGSRIPSTDTTAYPTLAVGNPADIIIRAIGLNSAQFVQSAFTITRATGQNFPVVSGLERNYNNPA
jgi:hypothetical protein